MGEFNLRRVLEKDKDQRLAVSHHDLPRKHFTEFKKYIIAFLEISLLCSVVLNINHR